MVDAMHDRADRNVMRARVAEIGLPVRVVLMRDRAGRMRRPERRDEQRRPREAPPPLPQVEVRFLPHAPAFESVIAQIKSGSVTYSVFALARLFLESRNATTVHLKAAEGAVLHQMGEHGGAATDPRTLEATAFANAKDEFYSSSKRRRSR